MTKITAQLAKQILKDRQAGLTYRQIGIKHCISKGSAQTIAWRTERNLPVGVGRSAPKPWAPHELDAIRAMADQGVSVNRMAGHLGRSKDRIRALLKELLGRPYARPPRGAHMEARQANLALARGETIAKRANDHLGHCLAVIRANGGCGFPAYDLPAMSRVAA